jgi:hypothetical protein
LYYYYVEYLLDAVSRTLPNQLLDPLVRASLKLPAAEAEINDYNDLATVLSPSIDPEADLPADQQCQPFVLQALPASAFVVAANQAPPVSDAALCGQESFFFSPSLLNCQK